MTGEELYRKAQNGGMGFPAFEKLSPGQKGLWENAAREASHEITQALEAARTIARCCTEVAERIERGMDS